MLTLDEVLSRVKHCNNPLYPSWADRNRMAREKRTWKYERDETWLARCCGGWNDKGGITDAN